jgi:hypothetical protein
MSVLPQTPRVSGGLCPPGPPTQGSALDPDPSPTHAPPNNKSWIHPVSSIFQVTKIYINKQKIYNLYSDSNEYNQSSDLC